MAGYVIRNLSPSLVLLLSLLCPSCFSYYGPGKSQPVQQQLYPISTVVPRAAVPQYPTLLRQQRQQNIGPISDTQQNLFQINQNLRPAPGQVPVSQAQAQQNFGRIINQNTPSILRPQLPVSAIQQNLGGGNQIQSAFAPQLPVSPTQQNNGGTNVNRPQLPISPIQQNPSGTNQNTPQLPLSPAQPNPGGLNQISPIPGQQLPLSPTQQTQGGQNNANNNNSPQNSNVGSSAISVGGAEIFDLSYTYDGNSIFYPGQRFSRFHLLRDVESNNQTSNNYEFSYASFSLCMSEHGGTHIDAPYHFNRYGWRVAEIPLSRLVDIPAAVIDVERHVFALKNPDRFILQMEHLQEHESNFGAIPRGALVLIYFGWGRFWPDVRRYTGIDNTTSAATSTPEGYTLSYPTVSPTAASWLLRERGIIGLGLDTMSADPSNGDSVVHILLLENQVYMIENVGNLDYLVQRTRQNNNRSCNLRALVMPIKTMGTGGPVRLTAYCRDSI